MIKYRYWIVSGATGSSYAAKNRTEAIRMANISNAENIWRRREDWFRVEMDDHDFTDAHRSHLARREEIGDDIYFSNSW